MMVSVIGYIGEPVFDPAKPGVTFLRLPCLATRRLGWQSRVSPKPVH
jgi:hypothetical protein